MRAAQIGEDVPVGPIQVEVSRQLIGQRLAIEAREALALRIGEMAGRHGVNGHDKWRILITIFVVGRDPRFSGPAERGTKRSGGFWPRMVDSCLSALRR